MPTIDVEYLDKMVESAQTNLNDSYSHYNTVSTTLAREFIELKFHFCMFQYDICVEMTTVVRNQPIGFAIGVALKGMVLRLFEFDLILRKLLIPRLEALAKGRDVELGDTIQQLKRDWRTELQLLQRWATIRNEVAGHYDPDIQKQVAALEGLTLDRVMNVTKGFMSFLQGLSSILAGVGSGVVGL